MRNLPYRTKLVYCGKRGIKKGVRALREPFPCLLWLAKIMKDKVGVEFFRDGNWDLSEAEVELGLDWLSK